jgi:polysaccharide deacetylase family protein (PEP-CTERM system associated)
MEKTSNIPRLQHVFTVDVEDWYHGAAEEQTRLSAQRRLHYGLNILLDILAEYDVRGTFFWLGPAAKEHPDLVNKVAKAGHEMGCHGWLHEPIYTMSPSTFRQQTRQAADAIASLTGKPVTIYRAPYFSLTKDSLWALEILVELGFKYDSSIFPIRHWRYGIPDFEPCPQPIDTPTGSIYEVPASVRQLLGRNVPVSGGGYFRLYPYQVTQSNFLALERQGQPAIFYVHPWELDLHRPSIAASWKERLANRINRESTEPKLRRLLGDFAFAPLGEVFKPALKMA